MKKGLILVVCLVVILATVTLAAGVTRPDEIMVTGKVISVIPISEGSTNTVIILGVPTYNDGVQPLFICRVHAPLELGEEWADVQVGEQITVTGVVWASQNYAFGITARVIEAGNTVP